MKYCPYCGSTVEENQLFCGNCGAKLEKEPKAEAETVNTPTEVQKPSNSDARIPHWCQKMFAIMGMWLAFFGGVGGIVLGTLGHCLGGSKCEYKGRYTAMIIIGAVFATLTFVANFANLFN